MNILKTLNTIAQCSQPSSGVTRLPFTKEHKQANKIITQWMKDAGMQIHLDAAGTLIGSYKSANKNAKTLILGCLLYTSPSPRDLSTSRMPSSA